MPLHPSTLKKQSELIEHLNKEITATQKYLRNATEEESKAHYREELAELNSVIRFISKPIPIHALRSVIADLHRLSDVSSGAINATLSRSIMSLGVLCALAALAATFVWSSPIVIIGFFSYLALTFLCVGFFVLGFRQGLSRNLHDFAADLEIELEFEVLAQQLRDNTVISNLMSSCQDSDSWAKLTPYLLVIKDIRAAHAEESLVQAEQKFNSIRQWTYMGLFPIKAEDVCYQAEAVIGSLITERRSNYQS